MNSSKRTVGVAAASIALLLFLSCLLLLLGSDIYLSVGVSLLLGAFFFLYAVNRGTANELFCPYSYFLLKGGLVEFGLPAIYLAVVPLSRISLRLPIEYIPGALLLVACSFIAFAVGFRLPLGRKLALSVPLFYFPRRLSVDQYAVNALCLYGAGWVARLGAFGLGLHHMNPDLGEATTVVSSILQPFSMFAILSYIVLLYIHFTKAREQNLINPFRIFPLSLLTLEVVYGMAMGSRSQMITPFIYLAFVYNYSYRKLAWRDVVVGIAILLFVLAPLSTMFRSAHYGKLERDGASISAVGDTIKSLSGHGETFYNRNLLDSVISRLSAELEGVTIVYSKVPSRLNYAGGETFFPSIITNFIPRTLWPEKPVYIPGREFAQIFWGIGVGNQYDTNMTISWIGESYYNFGWAGLIVAGVLGAIVSFFSTRCDFYARLEFSWFPRLYFVTFLVPVIGAFHYYPAGLLRAALFQLFYLSLLNLSLPRLMRTS